MTHDPTKPGTCYTVLRYELGLQVMRYIDLPQELLYYISSPGSSRICSMKSPLFMSLRSSRLVHEHHLKLIPNAKNIKCTNL